jgi:adenosylcobinamide kinase / adenosylcobinamide-phosphate guanylyltransferase
VGFLLVLGGARSGKSDHAARVAAESGMPVTFIATATSGDAEMTDRISRHRAGRPGDWETIEEPLDLDAAVTAVSADRFVVVDCLTLWVSNLLGAGVPAAEIPGRAGQLANRLVTVQGVVVSNEVGLGIVPTNELARTFRDLLGAVNAAFARCAERSVFMVAGKTLELT